MNKYKMLLAITAGLLISSTAFADDDYNCEGCSLSQMQSKAISFGEGEYRIYSFSTNLAYRFIVTCSGNVPLEAPAQPQSGAANSENRLAPSISTIDDHAGGGYSTNVVSNQCPFGKPLQVKTKSLFADEQHAFDLARQYISMYPPGAAGRGADMSYDTSQTPGNSSYGDSVYQILNDNYTDGQLKLEISEQSSQFELFMNQVAAGVASHFQVGPNQTTILVTFRDGSSIEYTYDYNTHQFTQIPHSAYDKNKKPVLMDNEKGYQGTYFFSTTDTNDYLDSLRRAGVTVVQSSGVAKGFSCTWNEGTKTLTCRVIYM